MYVHVALSPSISSAPTTTIGSTSDQAILIPGDTASRSATGPRMEYVAPYTPITPSLDEELFTDERNLEYLTESSSSRSPLFRQDGSWSGAQEEQTVAGGNGRRLLTLRHYNAAIHHMNNFTSERSPYAKLERLAQVCEEIDRAIKLFYEAQPEELRPAPEQLNVYVNGKRHGIVMWFEN